MIPFNPSQEAIDLCCVDKEYTPTIQIDTGEIVDNKPVYVEKPISKDDFYYNYYSQLMDSHAIESKQRKAISVAVQALPAATLVAPQIAKLPILTQKEIDDAVAEAILKLKSNLKPTKYEAQFEFSV